MNDNSVRLTKLLSSGEAQQLLRDLISRLKQEIDEPFEVDSTFGHNLSLTQTRRMQARVDKAKRTGSFGKYLKELAVKREYLRTRLFVNAGISASYWHEVLTDEKNPSKDFLFRVAIAWKLTPDETFELVQRAGYTLNDNEIPRDAAIKWCLEERIYDFYEVDDILEECGFQPLRKRS